MVCNDPIDWDGEGEVMEGHAPLELKVAAFSAKNF